MAPDAYGAVGRLIMVITLLGENPFMKPRPLYNSL